MWELYACWTLISLYFADYFGRRGAASGPAHAYAGAAAFAVIGAGAIGSVIAGRWADRIGRERVTIWAMAVSAGCSIAMGWLLNAPLVVTVGIGLIWGFAVVADSAQFSALVTEVAPPHAVGTALTLQTSLGFLLTALSIWLTIALSARYDWRVAFGMLAVGPVLGIVAMKRLQRAKPAGK
jgi:MFS family permease